ncbi:hypothetical protein Tco_0093590 [Tanacetum coccineum]
MVSNVQSQLPPSASTTMEGYTDHWLSRTSRLSEGQLNSGIESACYSVWICQILQEISQKRTRERMSDQEAKEIKAEAREIMPQPSTVNCS